jgi:hypothetical protein
MRKSRGLPHLPSLAVASVPAVRAIAPPVLPRVAPVRAPLHVTPGHVAALASHPHAMRLGAYLHPKKV